MRQQRWWRAGAGLALAIVAGACASDGAQDALGPSLSTVPETSLNLYGAGGLARAVPLTPCRGEGPHRQFDFWLGDWNVFNTAGSQIGTNIVTAGLDGCAVEEHWTDQSGRRGRSLNAWDAEDAQWHQTWVAVGLGHLRMAGNVVAETMVLEGRRVTAAGTLLLDTYTWFAFTPDSVRQTGLLEVPAIDLKIPFTGIYVRSDAVTPAPEVDPGNCQPGAPGAPNRWLDFWAGHWAVSADGGPSLGTSEVSRDLGGCLFEERFATARGYAAIVWTYYDAVERVWYRTYVDSEGERIELRGGVEEGALVLTGRDGTPAGAVLVRVRLTAEGADVLQVLEQSRDDGASWLPGLTLRYQPT